MWFLKRLSTGGWWRLFVVAFTLLWLAWCVYVITNYDEMSLVAKLLHGAGLALLSPDIDTLFGRNGERGSK